MKNYRAINDKLSGDKWETCWVAGDCLSRTLFPWTRGQWLQQLESSFLTGWRCRSDIM